MPQDLASLVRAAEAREREQQTQGPARAAGAALYTARTGSRSPQAAAIAEETGRVLGVPPMLVDQQAEHEARAQRDLIALSSAPRTAGFLSDEQNAAVAHDQVESLTALERVIGGLRFGANALAWQQQAQTRGLGSVARRAGGVAAAGALRTSQGVVGVTEAMTDVSDTLDPVLLYERLTGRAGLATRAQANRRQASRQFREEIGASASRSNPMTGNFYADAALQGLESVVPSLTGAVLAALSGGAAAPAIASGFLAVPAGGSSYGEARDRGLGVGQSLVYGVAQGTTEYAGERLLGTGKLVERLALGQPLIRSILRNQLEEQVGEQATTILQDLNEWATLNPTTPFSEYLKERPSAALQTAIATAVGTATTTGIVGAVAGPTYSAQAEAMRATDAQVDAKAFDLAAEAAENHPLKKLSPERYAAFLAEIQEPGAEVVVPAEAVATFFQSNPDLAEWMDEWGIRDQVEEAVAAGTDVVFDQATYLAKVVGTKADEAWRPDIRHGLGEMSAREAEAYVATGEDALSAEVDGAIEQAQAEVEAAAPERQVRDALFSQLREAGYTIDAANAQATIAARTFARRAERNPNRFPDAMAAYEAAGLTVQQEFPEVLRQRMDRVDVMIEALRRGRAKPTETRMFGRSMMEFLAQEGGVLDTGGELAAMGVDAWHRPSQGGRAFRRRFTRSEEQGGSNYAPDQAALRAVEAGYLPEGSGPNELFAAIREELSGRPTYSREFDADLQGQENAEALDELERLIGDLGLDPAANTNAEIKAALERAAEADVFPGDRSFDQGEAVNTESEAFKAWFGDSKVVDAEGNPLVVYHGTAAEFEAFDVAKIGSSATAEGYGFYFAENPDVARGYERDGGALMRVFLSIENPIDSKAKAFSKANTAKLIRAAIEAEVSKYPDEISDYKNSFLSNVTDTYSATEAEAVGEMVKVLLSNKLAVDQIAELANVMGSKELALRATIASGLADGIRVADFQQGDGPVWLAFEPTQIKSVNNWGTFDPADPRILYQSSGEALSDILASAEQQGVKLSVGEPRDGLSVLSMIDTQAAGQGQGIGTALMERLTAWADASGVKLALTPEAVGSTSKRRLVSFYKRHGFVENKGRTRDFSTREAMVRDPVEGRTLDQSTPFTGPRGQITFADSRATIKLFQSRDLSTFFHEFGHLTLEGMIDDARDPNASEEVKADMQIVLDWFSSEAGKPITIDDIGVDQHELWARGTERYLMEGKAPSLELRDVFRTVKAWLKSIYQSVMSLNAPISDEVRGVMDRLLASDAEIQQARDVAGGELGADAYRQLGATEAEVAAYERTLARTRSDAEDDLLGKVMRAIRRQRTAEWNEEADRIRPDVTAEVDAMPDVAALEFITTSRTPLSRETVVAMLGDEAGLALLPKRVPPIYSASSAVHPDMVAEVAGYPSGQAMLNGLMELEAEKRQMVEAGDKRSVRKARIEDRIRERMLEYYGDPLSDGSIEQEALDAIHSERYGDILALDLNLLARRSGQQPAPIDALRAWARERIGSRPVREARPGRYLKAERTASSAVQAALAKGDRAEAFRQKQAQTINNVLYVAARQAEAYADGAIARMRKLAGRMPSIHVDFKEQIDALLEQYELSPVSGRTVQRRQTLTAFIEAQAAAGEPVNIPAALLEAASKTNLADLTVDELRALDETVKHLVHLGRLKTRLILNGEQRDLDRLADAGWASAQALPDVPTDEAPGDKSAFERITGWGAKFEASMVKAQEYFRLLDGGDPVGTFATVLDGPGQDAAAERVRLQEEFWGPVVEAKNAVPSAVQKTWTDIVEDHPLVNPNTGQKVQSLKRRDLVGLALHTGTLGNFEKLAKGYGLVSREADAMEVSAARQGFIGWLGERLDVTEWAYVQSIWDAHERLRPTYFAMSRKIEGFEPQAVEAEVVQTPAGPIKGGYVPISYHPSYDAQAQRREQQDAASIFGEVMGSGPRPDNGSTNARTAYVGPVKIGLDDARYAAEKHITYAAYAEYVQNSLKFLRHPLVASTIKRKLGLAAYETMEPWVAGQVRDEVVMDPGANPILQIARGARSNMTAAVLMGSVTVLLAQPGGLAQSSIQLGPKWMAKGLTHAAGLLTTDNLRAFITERSEFMRLRVEQGDLDRDFRLAMQNARGAKGLRERSLLLTGKAIALVDFYVVSGATWLGAYDKALSEGRGDSEAVYLADKAVRGTQGGGRAIDQAGVQRANEVTKMLTFAYGWANAYYNMQRAAAVDFKNGHDRFENGLKFAALLILPALLDAFFSNDWPDGGDDAEEAIRNAAAWFARNVFFGAFSGVPVVRDIAGNLERKADGKHVGSLGQTPTGRIGDEVMKLSSDAWALAFDEDHEPSRRWPSHVINGVGLALGIPGTTQAARVVNYTTDVVDGEQNPDGVLDWMNGLMRGPQDDQK